VRHPKAGCVHTTTVLTPCYTPWQVHNLKPDAKLGVSEISAVVDGIKTDVFKQAVTVT
jgi:hypothetical protein